MQASWSGRAIAHRGKRWQVPAGIGHAALSAVMVTPPPAQLQVPLWVSGGAAGAVARSLALPVVANTPADVVAANPVAPARGSLSGDLDADRQAVLEWSAAGATHLICTLSEEATVEALVRRLAPEVAMVDFPWVVTETPPAVWPRSAGTG